MFLRIKVYNDNNEKVQTTVEYFFGEIKTYEFVDFTSQLKIGLSSVERIYLVYWILENAKTCLYSNKADDLFETNPITFIFCYCLDMKIYGTLIKHPGFQQRYKMIHN